MFEGSTTKNIFILATLLTLTTVLPMILPITLDESYYHLWSQSLKFGYFDHPPMVALVSKLDTIFPRMGTILLSIATFLLAAKLFYNLGIKQLLLCLLLFKFSIASIGASTLTTPDAPLLFFWILAIHEAFQALTRNPKRWITAGIATGLGLMSKYTMVLMGPIFLIALWKNKSLKEPWPYLGALAAFLILFPNLKWNAENNWTSFAFQLRRLSISQVEQKSDLPVPEIAKAKSIEERLRLNTLKKDPNYEEEKAPKKPSFQIPNFIQRPLDYLGGLLALWGFMLIPLFMLLRKKNRVKEKIFFPSTADHLIIAALWVPLLFFGILSLFTKVEANWSAMYMFALIPMLAPYVHKVRKAILVTSILNCIVALLLLAHAIHPFLPIKKDRLLKETFGFKELASHVQKLPEPIFADTYQLTSMLRYYDKEKIIIQWPNMNRPSEYTHNSEYSYSLSQLMEKNEFWLISSETIIPHIPLFKPLSFEVIKDCKTGTLAILSSESDKVENFDCRSVHQWSLIHYKVEK